MKCAVCGDLVQGKRLCEECNKAVNKRVKEMAKKYSDWFALKLRSVE